ncbi:hypothetical protein ACWPMX_07870 [Tsuneonella sp. HG094]
MSALEQHARVVAEALVAGVDLDWLDCPLARQMAELSMPWAAVQALIGMGVPAGFLGSLTGRGDLAVAQVELHRDGTFTFGGPDRRLILAVRDAAGDLVDLLAIASHCADEWALLTRDGDVLGEAVIEAAEARAVAHGRAELRLYGTPLAWMRAGGDLPASSSGAVGRQRGICVTDWGRPAIGRLRALGERVTLICDVGASDRLRAMLAHGGLPIVAEDRAMRRAA